MSITTDSIKCLEPWERAGRGHSRGISRHRSWWPAAAGQWRRGTRDRRWGIEGGSTPATNDRHSSTPASGFRRVPAAASNGDPRRLLGTEALTMNNLSIAGVRPPQVGVGRDPHPDFTSPVPISIPDALIDPAAAGGSSSFLQQLHSFPFTQVCFAPNPNPNLNAKALAFPAALVSPAREQAEDEDLSRCMSPPPVLAFGPVAAPCFGLAPQPVQPTPPQSEQYSYQTTSAYESGSGISPAAAPSSAFESAPTTGALSSEHGSWYSAPIEYEPGYSSVRSLGL